MSSDDEILSTMTIAEFADEMDWRSEQLIDVIGSLQCRTGLGEYLGGDPGNFRWQLVGDVLWRWMLLGHEILRELPSRICKDDPGMYRILRDVSDAMGRTVPLTRHKIHGEHEIPRWVKH